LKRVVSGGVTAAGLIAVLVLTLAIFGLPVVQSLRLIVEGAFGDKFALSRTLIKATPLILTGLGIVVAWKAGMYNIGGEGQFLVGGVAGIAAAKGLAPLGVPPFLGTTLVLMSCVVGGALWAGLAGWLHVKRGVQVVISTILLNFIALQLLGYAVSGPLQESAHRRAQSDPLPEAWMLFRFDRQMDLHAGVFIALAGALGVYVYLLLTKGGFRLRVVGDNPRVARANWINAGGVQLRAMLLSGALCGLAGGVELTGIQGTLDASFSQQWGFLAIPVALLGGLHPLTTVLSALYFGVLFAGSQNLARFTPAATAMIYVIQGVAVLGFVAVQSFLARRPARQEAT
jgi:general nucleoside transport system permease protein